MLKKIQKKLQKSILTAINNGHYGYTCIYEGDCYYRPEEYYVILNNKQYLLEYYKSLGYNIRIMDTRTKVSIEISW